MRFQTHSHYTKFKYKCSGPGIFQPQGEGGCVGVEFVLVNFMCVDCHSYVCFIHPTCHLMHNYVQICPRVITLLSIFVWRKWFVISVREGSNI